MKLQDKVVLITGAGGSIGSAVAARCLEEGALLALVDIDQAALNAVKEALILDDRHLLFRADVSDEAQVAAYVAAAVGKFGRIDVFHNNAGTTGKRKKLVDMDIAEYKSWLDVNLISIILGLKHVLPVMEGQGSGSVINMSSQVAHRPAVGGADYCLVKSAVIMLTKVAALETARTGVRVNCILPGYVDSEMMWDNFKMFPKLQQSIIDNVPAGRMCAPEEIGDLIVFLGGDGASYINGAEIAIDGGHLSNYM